VSEPFYSQSWVAKRSLTSGRPSSTTGPVGAQGAAADGGVFKQVKQFLAEAGQAAGNPSRVTSVVGSQHAGPGGFEVSYQTPPTSDFGWMVPSRNEQVKLTRSCA